MVTVFCTPEHRDPISRALPTSTRVSADWDEFASNLRGSPCLVLATKSLTEYQAELRELQSHFERCPHVALVVATCVNVENVDLLAPLRCHSIIDIERLETELPHRVLQIIERTPRQIAAAGLLCRDELSPFVRSIVEEVLLAAIAVRDMRDLERRLELPSYQIRRNWKRDLRPLAPVRLNSFLKFGRRLREAEMLAGGLSVQEIAVLLDVDESTVYRDLRGSSPDHGPERSDMLLNEYLAAFRLIGGAVATQTTREPIQWLFGIANRLFRIALDRLIYWTQHITPFHSHDHQ